MMDDTPRAEEILLALWKNIRSMKEAGDVPDRVVLGPASFRLIQAYRARLGELANPGMDYITRDSIFSLPVYIDDTADYEVQAK
jgi:hypothetical protein